jgi:hypothetical protein
MDTTFTSTQATGIVRRQQRSSARGVPEGIDVLQYRSSDLSPRDRLAIRREADDDDQQRRGAALSQRDAGGALRRTQRVICEGMRDG